jgi:hypothetical protein
MSIALGETLASAAEVPFYLGSLGAPTTGITGRVGSFGATEVQINLPVSSGSRAWIDVANANIVEKGFGWYAVQLTSAQTAVAGNVYILVSNDSLYQPYEGAETIGVDGGDMAVGVGGPVPIYLANAGNPVFGSPVTGHSWSTGETQIFLPGGGAFVNASTSNLSEIGNGDYELAVTAANAAQRGKIYFHVAVSGAQPYSGFQTILNPGGTGSGPVFANVSPSPSFAIPPATPVMFDVTDAGSTINLVVPEMFVDVTVAPEVVYDWSNTTPYPGGAAPGTSTNQGPGVFNPAYAKNSTVVAITNGWRFTIRRLNGWATPPTLHAFATDFAGNVAVL